MDKKQIGWYILPEANEYYNDFECAAWYEKIRVEAGRYPVFVYNSWFDDDGELRANGAYTSMDGVIVSDNFQSLYCGVPIGKVYDTTKNAGKPGHHGGFYYLYTIAEDVLGKNTGLPCEKGRFELLPEYEAKEKRFVSMYDGQEKTTHGIFKKTEDIA